MGSAAHGQTSSSSSPAQSSSQSQSEDEGSDSTLSSGAPIGNGMLSAGGAAPGNAALGNPTSAAALSSDQITSILEESPDLVLELKSELADQLEQQGTEIELNEISDADLYQQIATNAALRANITTVLRARGYLFDNDLQSVGSSEGASDLSSQTSPGGATAETELAAPPAYAGSSRKETQPVRSNATPRRPREREQANASTDLPKVMRLPVPYNLESMRDLYAQIPAETPHLRRFGSDVFVNRSGPATASGVSPRNTPLDVPLGPDYVVGPGDVLTIDLWGGITQRLTRVIGRDGRVLLPEAGAIQLAGLTLGKAEALIEAKLKPQYRNVQVAVTVSGLRSVRVYVVGDVQLPGGYDISALATPLGALYAAGGPTRVGSLRTLLHYRGKQLVEKIDLYDFLLHGIRDASASFESGDTLLVPPTGPEVAISGAVKRPAIYETTSEETSLASVISDAGGLTAAASLSRIRIERIDTNQKRVTVTLPIHGGQDLNADHAGIEAFEVKDGDRIEVEPILPYSERAVYLVGHVTRPGRMPYSEGMHLSDVLRSYQDMLPEPADRGEVVRLVPPDLHAETLSFEVPDVLIGNANIDLRPFDTIEIFGRYQMDAPEVTIRGEVLHPGKYPMSNGMTAAQLVRMAGGLKRDALRDTADLASYEIEDGNRIVENLATVQIGTALSGTQSNADVPLKPGDVLSIHQITNWDDIGESLTIDGQVRYPGAYGFRDGERLSAVLRRAGGLLPTAYPAGAVLEREQVRELEEKSRDELVRQIEVNSAAARVSPALAGSNSAGALEIIKAQQDQVLADLKSHPPVGRMVIHISSDIGSWANTTADIELRRGDVLTIPKQPGFVLVTGQVYNATALTFSPGKTAEWYLSRAGGASPAANRKEIFIIRANGTVVGRRSGAWFSGDVLSTKLNPGDVVVVPQKIIGGSLLWRNLLAAGQIAASAAITAGVTVAAL